MAAVPPLVDPPTECGDRRLRRGYRHGQRAGLWNDALEMTPLRRRLRALTPLATVTGRRTAHLLRLQAPLALRLASTDACTCHVRLPRVRFARDVKPPRPIGPDCRSLRSVASMARREAATYWVGAPTSTVVRSPSAGPRGLVAYRKRMKGRVGRSERCRCTTRSSPFRRRHRGG